MSGSPDAVIIGGGVIGCAIALEMSRRGPRVCVVDQGPAAGAGSTSASSAIIRFHYSTRDGVVAAWEAMHIWREWENHLDTVDESGFTRFHQPGVLVIDPPAGNRDTVLRLFDEVGVRYERWDEATFRARMPAMDTGRFWPPRAVSDPAFWGEPEAPLDAYFQPDGGFVDDPQLAAHNLMVAADARGADFRFRTRVEGIETAGGRVNGVRLASGEVLATPVVINAAGPYSPTVNEMAGVLDDFRITTRALRQEVHALDAPRGFALGDGGAVVADADLGTYFRPQPGGSLLVGGLEPECDPLVWLSSPDDCDGLATVEVWEAQVLRLSRRLPGLGVPPRPRGLAAVYDTTPDWIPVYDRTALDGFYVAIGTSGNQFKTSPLVGRFIAELVDACEAGHDHDADPVQVQCAHTPHAVNLGHYSRRRDVQQTTFSVLG